MTLFLIQLLNGVQYGALLFMLASGLTLIFGVMGIINLAHGSFYMVGAFCAAYTLSQTGSFALAALAGLIGASLYGILIELVIIRRLYDNDILYQVLATFGLILFSNEAVSMIFGRQPPLVSVPEILQGTVPVVGIDYPMIRFAFIATGILVAVLLWWLIKKTRIGMLVRAGADDREIVSAMGINIRLIYTLVFGFGALLCGLAGVMSAPLFAVEIGMGENVLITAFVVIVIGGVGSVSGALVGALLVGIIDSMGHAYLPIFLSHILAPDIATPLASGLSTSLIYILMIVVLVFRPTGLIAKP